MKSNSSHLQASHVDWAQVVGTGGATDADIDMALALVKAAEVH